jgi:hypothetical protein
MAGGGEPADSDSSPRQADNRLDFRTRDIHARTVAGDLTE